LNAVCIPVGLFNTSLVLLKHFLHFICYSPALQAPACVILPPTFEAPQSLPIFKNTEDDSLLGYSAMFIIISCLTGVFIYVINYLRIFIYLPQYNNSSLGLHDRNLGRSDKTV
jgi:hypothetical protein